LGEELGGYVQFSPAQLFQVYRPLDVDRFINSANAQWRPLAWMQNDATVGMDLADRVNNTLNRLNEGPASGTTRSGVVADSHNNDQAEPSTPQQVALALLEQRILAAWRTSRSAGELSGLLRFFRIGLGLASVLMLVIIGLSLRNLAKEPGKEFAMPNVTMNLALSQ
jgi:hypothetical protein